jgi:hypothetical protein
MAWGCSKSTDSGSDPLLLGSGQTMKINFTNNTGKYPDDSIFISIMGEDASGNVCWIDSLGNLVQVKTADNTYGGYCNYFHKLADFKSVNLPALIGARIRVSIGKIYKMKINTENPHAAYTDADLNNPNDPNRKIIFDKIEFSYVGGILYLNTTTVDFFGIPFNVSGKVGSQDVTVGWKSSRKQLFDAFNSLAPADFKSLIQGNYRIVAPHKLLAFNSGYFNNYIDSVWAKYKTDSLVITGVNPDWRAAGLVDNSGVMKFKYTLGPWKGETVSISKPSSSNVFACDGVGSLKTDGSYPQSHQRLIPKVAGALNRTILLGFDASRGCDTATFYKRPVTNWFSKVLHLCALNNKCYGFPYDDDCEQSSLFPNGQVSVLNIEIGKFE